MSEKKKYNPMEEALKSIDKAKANPGHAIAFLLIAVEYLIEAVKARECPICKYGKHN